MAKCVSGNEKPYRPVDEALVRSVLRGSDSEETTSVSDNTAAPSVRDSTLSEQITLNHQQSPPIQPAPVIEKLSREKRVLLTKSEEREIERFVSRLAEELETPLKLSHVLRSCMTILRHAQKEIIAQASHSEKLERPPNGDPVALAEFEYKLAQIISDALSKTPPLD